MIHSRLRRLSLAFLVVVGTCGAAGCLIRIPGPQPAPLNITPATLPHAVEGRAYEAVVFAEPDTATAWEVTSGVLPVGVTLSRESGRLTGTPLEPGTFTFTVTARDGSLFVRSGQFSQTLRVIPTLVLNAALNAGRVGEAYSGSVVASGGEPPYGFESLGLPAGLAFDPVAGTISGTPQFPAEAVQLQFRVTDSGSPSQTTVFSTSIEIKPRPVSITTTTLPMGQLGVSYSQAIAAVDGSPPYSWRVAALSGVLPSGLRLNPDTGAISGVPTSAGEFTFTIEVADSDDPASVASQAFVLTITE